MFWFFYFNCLVYWIKNASILFLRHFPWVTTNIFFYWIEDWETSESLGRIISAIDSMALNHYNRDYWGHICTFCTFASIARNTRVHLIIQFYILKDFFFNAILWLHSAVYRGQKGRYILNSLWNSRYMFLKQAFGYNQMHFRC